MTEEHKHKKVEHLFKFKRAFLLFAFSYVLLYFFMIINHAVYDFLITFFNGLGLMIPIFFPIVGLINLVLPIIVWDSPLFFLLPIPGFFLMYYGLDWISEYFEFGDLGNQLFPYVFILLSLLAFYIILMWFYYNHYFLVMMQNPQVQEAGLDFMTYLYGGTLKTGESFSGLGFNYFTELKKSPYLIFIVSALLGWFSRKFVVDIIENHVK